MIRRWGAVLMAAAGLSLSVGAPAGATTTPGPRHWSPDRSPNQKITFVRSASLHGETIRATAQGLVEGFGTARVLSFEPDPATGRFRGVWELAFKRGTIRYAFTGQARDVAIAAQMAAPLALPAAPDPSRALVAGTFELLGGTGCFAGVTGRGTFQGWTVPEDDLPLLRLAGSGTAIEA